MNGVWKIDIKYFDDMDATEGLAIGVMVSDEDVERNSNAMVMAFDMAFRQIKQQVNKTKGVKNDKRRNKNNS